MLETPAWQARPGVRIERLNAPHRLYARVNPQGKPKVHHYVGLPPELDPGGHRSELPGAALVIVEPEEHGFLLLRYSESGEFGGDTWHEDLDAAKAQAAFEYSDNIEWTPVLSSTKNTDEVALELLRAI